MSIAVFGASGLLGSEVTYQALQRGEEVVAFVRDPSKLKIPAGSGGGEAGTAIQGDKLKVQCNDSHVGSVMRPLTSIKPSTRGLQGFGTAE